ncbi:hypothetical protein WA016_06353 [Myxococcus stipitatus]
MSTELIQQMVGLRKRLGQVSPGLESLFGKRPTGFDESNPAWSHSLECFDAMVEGEDISILGMAKHRDDSLARRLLTLLRVNLTRAKEMQDASLEALLKLEGDWRNLQEPYEYAWRLHVDEISAHPGYALVVLKEFLVLVNPLPRIGDAVRAWREEVGEIRKGRPAQVFSELRGILYDGKQGTGVGLDLKRQIEPHICTLREGLVFRVGTRLSLASLFNRFQSRCEQHDAPRLRALVDEVRRRKGKPEDVLRDQLALWLFDQGLNPVTEPRIGNLRPDLLDPGALYIEAKQYDRSPRVKIIRGMYQMYDTFRRLRGAHPEVNEGFFVVFRRAGPHVTAPPSVSSSEGWIIHIKFVDLADGGIGSRQKQRPVDISMEEISPERGL